MFIAVLICIKKDSRGLIDATLERMDRLLIQAIDEVTPLHLHTVLICQYVTVPQLNPNMQIYLNFIYDLFNYLLIIYIVV